MHVFQARFTIIPQLGPIHESQATSVEYADPTPVIKAQDYIYKGKIARVEAGCICVASSNHLCFVLLASQQFAALLEYFLQALFDFWLASVRSKACVVGWSDHRVSIAIPDDCRNLSIDRGRLQLPRLLFLFSLSLIGWEVVCHHIKSDCGWAMEVSLPLKLGRHICIAMELKLVGDLVGSDIMNEAKQSTVKFKMDMYF